MKDYSIRIASTQDEDHIMSFIDNYWSKDHILAVDKVLFEWQYRKGEQLNFIIAEAITDNEIVAVLGFIMYGDTFDEDIMLALWKSKEKKKPFLGMELLDYLIKLGTGKVSCNGINLKTTKVLYEFMEFRIDYLRQYYRLVKKDQYSIANITNPIILPLITKQEFQLLKFNNDKELDKSFDWQQYYGSDTTPHKSKEFIIHRYFTHPSYQYLIYGITKAGDSDNVSSFMLVRKIEVNQSSILRIVDWIGNPADIAKLSDCVDQLLSDFDVEYIDFMAGGIEDTIMEQAGFIKNEQDSGNIIPNYFEPFECSNVKVWYSTKYLDSFVIFKADGDQDRPNRRQ